MIQIEDLSFHYADGGFSLRLASLHVQIAERVAIVGASGCGKPTLATLIAGICVCETGRITVNQAALSEMTDRQRRDFRIANVGFIFQEFELLEYLRVDQNVLLPYFINRSLRLDQQARLRAQSLLESVGLGDKTRRFPGQLSQGERQRVAICRALVTEPPVIIADEPTGDLDPDNAAAVMDLIHEQMQRRQATFVMITHDRSLLDRFDRVIDLQRTAGDQT